jgi:lipid-binding SYLF domain-containing protein
VRCRHSHPHRGARRHDARRLQANVTTTALVEPVYAITSGQQGLMAALALNGTKITRFQPRG